MACIYPPMETHLKGSPARWDMNLVRICQEEEWLVLPSFFGYWGALGPFYLEVEWCLAKGGRQIAKEAL